MKNPHPPLIALIKASGFTLLALLACFTGISASAQSEATTTPAPPKTSIPIVPATAAPSSETTPSEMLTPFTQADLVRLTANVQRPNGLFWFEGNLYTACTGDGTIYEIDDTTGATRTYIYGIRNAHSLYVEDNATTGLTLWVPDYEANIVAQVTRNGVRAVVRDLNGPWGIAFVDEEQFLLTSLLGNSLNLVTRDGENSILLNDLAAPTGIVLDGDFVYLTNTGSTRRALEWYSLDTILNGTFERMDATSQVLVSGVQNAAGLQLAPDGYLYFTYALGTRGVVGRVQPEACIANGGCTNEDVQIVLYSDLTAPLAGLIITPDARLFVHEMFSPDLYWLSLER